MLPSDKFWEMAELFMEVVWKETSLPVLVFNDQGIIALATDKTRIGDPHAGAEKIMQGMVDEYAVSPEEAARNPLVREGYSCPIEIDGQRVAAFGITGKLALAKPLARVAAKMIDSWIADREHQEQLEISERKYRSIFDQSVQGLFQTTLDGRLVTANASLARMYGYPSPETLLSEIGNVSKQLYVNPEDRRRLIARLEEEGRVTGFLTQYRRRDGQVIDVSVNAQFVLDPETGQCLTEGFVEDITARKQAEKALKESEEKYFKAFNNSPVLVVLSSLDTGRYIEVNETFLSTMGYAREEILGRTSLELDIWVNLEDRQRIKKILRAEGYVRDLEVNRRTRDGRILTMLFSAERIDVAGETCMLSVSQDISERIKTREEIRQRRQFLELVLSHAPDAIITTDAHHHVIDWNPGAVRIFGYSPDEAIGRPLDDLVARNEPYREAALKTDEVLSGKRVEPFESIRYHKDGTPLHVIAAGSPIIVDNALKGVVAVYTDITDRKEAEARLKESHERFLTVLESIDATIYVADMETFEILYMNETMKQAFGGDLTGKTCHEVFRNQPRKCDICTNDQLLDTNGRPAEVCIWEDQNPVTKRWYINHDRAIQWVDGRIVRLQVATDITRQKMIETERKDYEARIQQMQKMEAIGMLAGGIAHDFNNILSAVIGYAELALIDTTHAPQVHSNIRQIHTSGMRARDLVKQILTFSRQDEKELKPLRIGLQIKEALKMLRSSLPTTIEITSHITRKVGNVMADPTQIHQIVMNLCTNAAQAMEDTGGALTVSLSQRTLTEEEVRLHPGLQAGDYVILSVQDTGKGIPFEIRDKIFNPYFTTKEKGKGTGLGLAVVHGIVQSYGGDIQVISASGEGTRFEIYLPVVQAAAETDAQPPALPGGHEKILLVDDEDLIVDFARQGLERLGYRVKSFTSSVTALDAFHQAPETFDVIITDMTMPKITGDQLAREILQKRPDMPIILCTGYTSRIDSRQANAMGIRAMLMKPLNLSDLANNVRRVLDTPPEQR